MSQPAYLSKLLAAARNAARNAYAPYSQFQVGAAILTSGNEIITGCNVENASFGLTICAERSAVVSAVALGQKEWQAIAIVSPTGVTPCGACRQVLAEFAPQLEVWFAHLDPEQSVTGPISLEALLPGAMKFKT